MGSKNETVLSKHGDFIWDAVAARLTLWLEHYEKIGTHTPVELIKLGLVDPVKVFVKKEPHKLSKILEGRVRIIASVSLVDQLIERLLHRVQNMTEIERWESCPSKPGLGLHDDGLEVLTHNMEDLLKCNGKIDCSDVSAWDWTTQEWELDLDMEVRVRLAGQQPDSLYGKLCRVNAVCVGRSVFITPDGKMRSQAKVYGGQLTGRYCTSSSNSRMRILATALARLRLTGKVTVTMTIKETSVSTSVVCTTYREVLGIISMGDDSVEVSIPGMQEQLNEIGHVCKMVETHTQVKGIDFCSQVFDGKGFAYPSAPAKTVYRFLSHKHSELTNGDLWVQLSFYFRHLFGEEKDLITKLAIARIERARSVDGNSGTEISS